MKRVTLHPIVKVVGHHALAVGVSAAVGTIVLDVIKLCTVEV